MCVREREGRKRERELKRICQYFKVNLCHKPEFSVYVCARNLRLHSVFDKQKIDLLGEI